MRDHELPSLFGLVGGWLGLQGFGFRIRLHFQFQRKDCWDSIVEGRAPQFWAQVLSEVALAWSF